MQQVWLLVWQYSRTLVTRKLIMPYYAVARGKKPGIYLTWEECKNQVLGFHTARYKKFNTPAEAQIFINENRAQDLPGVNVTKTVVYPTPAASSAASSSTSLTTSDQEDDGEQQQEQPRSLSPTLMRMQEQLKRLNKRAKQLQKQFDNYVKFKASSNNRRSIAQQRRNISTDTSSSTNENTDELDAMERTSGQTNKRKSSEEQNRECKRPNTGCSEINNLVIDEEGYLVVYTDGACTNNGRSGARAGLGVWFNHNHFLNFSSPVTGRATNNVGEIQAATTAVKIAKQQGFYKVKIITDSQFLINSMTKWIRGWKKKGWKVADGGPVKNKENFQELETESRGVSIKWEHCRGHAGIVGNECADALARKGADMYGKT